MKHFLKFYTPSFAGSGYISSELYSCVVPVLVCSCCCCYCCCCCCYRLYLNELILLLVAEKNKRLISQRTRTKLNHSYFMINWSWLSHLLWSQQLNKLKITLKKNPPNASELQRDVFAVQMPLRRNSACCKNMSQQRSAS